MKFFQGDLTSDAPLIDERHREWLARAERMQFDATNGTLGGFEVPDTAHFLGARTETGPSFLHVYPDAAIRDMEYQKAKAFGGPDRVAYPEREEKIPLGIRSLEKMWDAPVRVIYHLS